MKPAERFAAFVTDHSKLVVAVLLLSTLVVGSAAGNVDGGLSIVSFESDSAEADAANYVNENFVTGAENTTTAQVVVRGDNVLSRSSLLASLRFQRALTDDPAINDTLRDARPIVDIANLVATAAYRADGGNATAPSLDTQIRQLDSMDDAAVRDTVSRVLAPNRTVRGVDPYTLLPSDYDPGSTTADARIIFVFQYTAGSGSDGLSPAVTDAQLALQDLATDRLPADSFVFGTGIVDDESTRATGESFAIIGPAALVLILAALAIAYRDLLDVILGLLGVALVLVWMMGFMGWAGIGLTQILIAVPFLLVGLSIDYALHVVMRYREARADGADDPRTGMRRGLAGVAVALFAATFTTAVGFSSNAVSPLRSIRDFGIVSAAGIVAAFLVFALLLPALKVELDALLERFGRSRDVSAFGRGRVVGRALSVGVTAAKRAPYVVIALAVVASVAGGVAASDINTSVDQADFLPRDAPGWTDVLPASLQPSDYSLRDHAAYVEDRFAQARGGSNAEFLIRGDITDPGTLDDIAAARDRLANTTTAATLADGTLRLTGPLATVRAVAERNDTVAAVVADADTDGDGIPDRNLASVYDAVYAAAPDDARATIYREGGEYRALRLSVGLAGNADADAVVSEMRTVASALETSDRSAIATGRPIVTELVQRSVLTTLVEGFVITFLVIVAFLTLLFWVRYRSLALGGVVILPVVLSQAWVFGTMYLAGLSFTPETAIIAAIGIGIGVDYAIHVGERFVDEHDDDPYAALHRTARGTGGALLASAATTVGGFGVLVLALVPSLQRFGFVTAVAITYAFVASVFVLPSLLVVWSRFADRTT